uniref:Uncharacterized protein n=1 Tax=viral metagenome TaxID=1070528 RepID=A0A6C0C807_9ZZZZ
MQFEPLGGFPPLVRVEDVKITGDEKKNISTRGFSSANIINIRNILNQQKKTYTEGKYDSDELLFNEPIEYLKLHE